MTISTGERHVRVRVGCGTFKAKILWVILGMNDLTQPPVLYSVEEKVWVQWWKSTNADMSAEHDGMHLCGRNLGHDDDVVRLYVENVVPSGAFLLCLTSHNAAESSCRSSISTLPCASVLCVCVCVCGARVSE
jgi:hypothetical protein